MSSASVQFWYEIYFFIENSISLICQSTICCGFLKKKHKRIFKEFVWTRQVDDSVVVGQSGKIVIFLWSLWQRKNLWLLDFIYI